MADDPHRPGARRAATLREEKDHTMAHALNFDVTTEAGQAIVDLFDGIKTNIEDSTGGWSGVDVVDALTDWFVALGFDIEEGPVGSPAE